MYTIDVGRNELLKIFASSGIRSTEKARRDTRDRNGLGTLDARLVWARAPEQTGELPFAIVIDESSVDDFLAWSAAYLSSFRPFTSYFRVLSENEQELLKQSSSAGDSTGRKLLPCVAMVLCEAYLNSRETVSTLDELSLNSCLSTLSYTFGRSVYVGYEGRSIESLGNAWQLARTLTKQGDLTWSVDQLRIPWEAYFVSFENHFALEPFGSVQRENNAVSLGAVVQELANNGRLASQTLKSFGGVLSVDDFAKGHAQNSREARVATLEEAIAKALSAGSRSLRAADSLLLGFLASQIAPGTLDHIALLKPCAKHMPAAFLWYGFFSSVSPENEILTSGSGLGRYVLRELARLEEFASRPLHDISLRELRILVGASPAVMDFRTANPGYLDVELMPFVRARLRRSRPELGAKDSRGETLLEQRFDEIAQLADKVIHDLDLIRHLASVRGGVRGRQRRRR